MRQVVDRIVNSKAVLLDNKGKQKIVPLKKLPKNLREGDILIDGKISRQETSKAKARVKGLLDQLLKRK